MNRLPLHRKVIAALSAATGILAVFAASASASPATTPKPGMTVRIHDSATHKCVNDRGASVHDGALVIEYACSSNRDEYYTLKPVGKSTTTFYLVNSRSHECIDDFNAGNHEGNRIDQQPCHGWLRERWIFGSWDGGHYYDIYSAVAPDFAMRNGTTRSTKGFIVLESSHGGAGEDWYLTK